MLATDTTTVTTTTTKNDNNNGKMEGIIGKAIYGRGKKEYTAKNFAQLTQFKRQY